MGLLSMLFGGGDSPSIDGLWLHGERDSSWKTVAQFSAAQPIELSPESCYTNRSGTFCVLKSFDPQNAVVLFMGCFVPPDQDEMILIVVDRHETQSGRVVKADDWTKNRVLAVSKYPSVKNAIDAARGRANFNGYSTLPPFVMHLTMNLSS